MTETHRTDTSVRRRQTAARGKRRLLLNRLTLVLPVIAVAVVLGILACLKKSCDVDVNLRVGQLSFTVNDDRVNRLFNSIDVKSMTISRFDRLNLYRGQLEFTGDVDAQTGEPTRWHKINITEGDGKHIVPSEPFSNLTLESVTLNRVNITPGAKANMSWSEDEPDSLKVSLNKSASGEVMAGETLLFTCTGCKVDGSLTSYDLPSLSFRLRGVGDTGQTVHFQGRGDATIIALNLAPNTKFKEQNIVVHEEVDFTRQEGGRLISTVMEGKILVEDVNKEINVTEGTIVELNALDKAVIKTVGIDKGINISLRGRTGRLFTGTEGNLKSQLPSLLEWLYERHTWVLVVQALLAIVPLIFNILGALKIFPKASAS